MNTRKNIFRKLAGGICLLASGIYVQNANAQCDNITVTVTAAPSICMQNGTLTVSVTGPDAANLSMSTAQYAINPVSGTNYSQAWAQAPGGILTDVPPGTYNVQVRAFCSVSNDYVVKTTNNTATVTSTYVVPNAYVGPVRKTFNCTQKYIGRIPVVVAGGLAPYNVVMTGKPAAYTGQTTFTMASAGTLNVDNLPAGDYSFTVVDNCTYNTDLTATVGTYTADYDQSMVYNYPYMMGSYTTDCRAVRLSVKYLSTAHELYPIYNSEFYEIGFTYNAATQPTVWQDAPASSYVDYLLQHDRDDFRKNGYYVAVWVRIKGTNCAYKVRDVKAYTGTTFSLSYTQINCDTAQVSHYIQGTSFYNFFCYPYQWCVVRPTAPYDTIIPWSEPVTNTSAISAKMAYGSRIVYRDAKGNIFTTTTQTSMINNISMSASYYSCSTPNASGYIASLVYIYSSNNPMPVGTRIQYISGPPGAPAPASPDMILTSSTNSVYPYGSSSTTYMVPGTYRFKVTLPNNCGEKEISASTYMRNVITGLQISSTAETCDGMRIFPAGQLGYISGTNQYNIATWFALESGPAGVSINKQGVQVGGSLLLPASGRYTIKITTDEPTNTYNACAFQTITFDYEKRPLALDVNVTSAYVCEGSGTLGNMRVKGINGTGSYTYQLRTQGGGTLIQSNATGVFNYGAAGQTYTIRVIDNNCNTQFDQNVTILDLSDAQITYSSGSTNNVFCEGQTLRVNCITLGSTIYSWTGPGGWTSTEQNPTRPNATPEMSGRYTVTVTPEGCGLPMTQYIDILVNRCMATINPHLRSRAVH